MNLISSSVRILLQVGLDFLFLFLLSSSFDFVETTLKEYGISKRILIPIQVVIFLLIFYIIPVDFILSFWLKGTKERQLIFFSGLNIFQCLKFVAVSH